MAEFTWRENLACVATYKVLEGDQFLDQFEDTDIPFDEAGPVKLGDLRYYPKTTDNPRIIELLALEIARTFLRHVVKLFTVTKEIPKDSSADIIRALQSRFADKDATIEQLAGVLDAKLKFPDETGGAA